MSSGIGTVRDSNLAGSKRVLSVFLERAFNLKSRDFLSKQDQYCVLKCAKKEEKSLTVKGGGTNPIWNQTFTFYVGPNDHMLYVEIFGRDFLKREDLVGYANVPLAQTLQVGKAKMLVPVFTDEERMNRHGSLELDLELLNSPNRHSTPRTAQRLEEPAGPLSQAYTLNMLNVRPKHTSQPSWCGNSSDGCSNLTGVTGASHSPLFNDPRHLHHSSSSFNSFNAWQLEHSLSNMSSTSVEAAGEAAGQYRSLARSVSQDTSTVQDLHSQLSELYAQRDRKRERLLQTHHTLQQHTGGQESQQDLYISAWREYEQVTIDLQELDKEVQKVIERMHAKVAALVNPPAAGQPILESTLSRRKRTSSWDDSLQFSDYTPPGAHSSSPPYSSAATSIEHLLAVDFNHTPSSATGHQLGYQQIQPLTVQPHSSSNMPASHSTGGSYHTPLVSSPTGTTPGAHVGAHTSNSPAAASVRASVSTSTGHSLHQSSQEHSHQAGIGQQDTPRRPSEAAGTGGSEVYAQEVVKTGQGLHHHSAPLITGSHNLGSQPQPQPQRRASHHLHARSSSAGSSMYDGTSFTSSSTGTSYAAPTATGVTAEYHNTTSTQQQLQVGMLHPDTSNVDMDDKQSKLHSLHMPLDDAAVSVTESDVMDTESGRSRASMRASSVSGSTHTGASHVESSTVGSQSARSHASLHASSIAGSTHTGASHVESSTVGSQSARLHASLHASSIAGSTHTGASHVESSTVGSQSGRSHASLHASSIVGSTHTGASHTERDSACIDSPRSRVSLDASGIPSAASSGTASHTHHNPAPRAGDSKSAQDTTISNQNLSSTSHTSQHEELQSFPTSSSTTSWDSSVAPSMSYAALYAQAGHADPAALHRSPNYDYTTQNSKRHVSNLPAFVASHQVPAKQDLPPLHPEVSPLNELLPSSQQRIPRNCHHPAVTTSATYAELATSHTAHPSTAPRIQSNPARTTESQAAAATLHSASHTGHTATTPRVHPTNAATSSTSQAATATPHSNHPFSAGGAASQSAMNPAHPLESPVLYTPFSSASHITMNALTEGFQHGIRIQDSGRGEPRPQSFRANQAHIQQEGLVYRPLEDPLTCAEGLIRSSYQAASNPTHPEGVTHVSYHPTPHASNYTHQEGLTHTSYPPTTTNASNHTHQEGLTHASHPQITTDASSPTRPKASQHVQSNPRQPFRNAVSMDIDAYQRSSLSRYTARYAALSMAAAPSMGSDDLHTELERAAKRWRAIQRWKRFIHFVCVNLFVLKLQDATVISPPESPMMVPNLQLNTSRWGKLNANSLLCRLQASDAWSQGEQVIESVGTGSRAANSHQGAENEASVSVTGGAPAAGGAEPSLKTHSAPLPPPPPPPVPLNGFSSGGAVPPLPGLPGGGPMGASRVGPPAPPPPLGMHGIFKGDGEYIRDAEFVKGIREVRGTPIGLKGQKSKGEKGRKDGATGADVVEELKRRGGHLARVLADAEKYQDMIQKLAAKVETINTSSMLQLSVLVDSVNSDLDVLVDVPAVLKQFPEWPESRFDTMQEAVHLYRQVSLKMRGMDEWQPPATAAKAIIQSKLKMDTVRHFVDRHAPDRPNVEKRFRAHGLPWDPKIWDHLNKSALRLCAAQLKLTLAATQPAAPMQENQLKERVDLLHDTLDMTYRVYQMVGAYNREVQQLSKEAIQIWKSLTS